MDPIMKIIKQLFPNHCNHHPHDFLGTFHAQHPIFNETHIGIDVYISCNNEICIHYGDEKFERIRFYDMRCLKLILSPIQTMDEFA